MEPALFASLLLEAASWCGQNQRGQGAKLGASLATE